MQGVDTSFYNYNSQSGQIHFNNGSEVFLKDLFLYPSDPDFDDLGSLEITGAFIDEASQVTSKAKNTLKSRIRYKLDEFNLSPTLLMTTNPTRGFIYEDYYKPHVDDTLIESRRFIQSLAGDNPHLAKSYIKLLEELDETSRKRLLLGDWNYIDDPSLLVSYDAVDDLFSNDHVKPNGNKHLSNDIAPTRS